MPEAIGGTSAINALAPLPGSTSFCRRCGGKNSVERIVRESASMSRAAIRCRQGRSNRFRSAAPPCVDTARTSLHSRWPSGSIGRWRLQQSSRGKAPELPSSTFARSGRWTPRPSARWRRVPAVVVVDEDYASFGLSGEIAAVLAESGIASPFARVATTGVIPYARHLEREVLPSVERIAEAVRRLMAQSA